MGLPSYPKVWSFGSKIPMNPFDGKPAVFQEKVDGSQFSFGLVDGEIHMRSKNQPIQMNGNGGMFSLARDTVAFLSKRNLLPHDVIFRGEYLSKPKHNTLKYGRVPDLNVVVFDVFSRDLETGLWWWEEPESAKAYANYSGLEYVPTWEATVTHADQVLEMIDRDSFLSTEDCQVKVEGVVMKRYDLIVPQFSSPLFCKYVSERFKEVHRTSWKNANPSGKEFMDQLADTYRTEARWEKAVQHLAERGQLECDPRDIGPLLKEVSADVLEECEDEIRDALFKEFWKKHGARAVGRGLPEWYKERLLRDSFTEAA